MKVKEQSEKAGLNLKIQKMKINEHTMYMLICHLKVESLSLIITLKELMKLLVNHPNHLEDIDKGVFLRMKMGK